MRGDGITKIFLSLIVALSGLAALLPVAPPWPDRLVVLLVSAFASALAVGGSMVLAARAWRSPWPVIVALLLVLGGYLFLFNALVLRSETTNSVVVRGLWCSQRALQIKMVAAHCPFLSEDDLLGKDFDADFFWPPLAISASRTLLLVSWLGMIAVLSFAAASAGRGGWSPRQSAARPVQDTAQPEAAAADPGIFISHSSKDQPVVAELCAALEQRGFKCWFAPRDVKPGDNYQEAIHRAIRTGKVMVLVLTANANASGEIQKEVALASQYRLVVIPVRLEDVRPNDALAYEFATRQWIDLFSGFEDGLVRLGNRISELTRARPVNAPDAAPLNERARG
jgi:hypothetical protein